jgi:hypothetical protein
VPDGKSAVRGRVRCSGSGAIPGRFIFLLGGSDGEHLFGPPQ